MEVGCGLTKTLFRFQIGFHQFNRCKCFIYFPVENYFKFLVTFFSPFDPTIQLQSICFVKYVSHILHISCGFIGSRGIEIESQTFYLRDRICDKHAFIAIWMIHECWMRQTKHSSGHYADGFVRVVWFVCRKQIWYYYNLIQWMKAQMCINRTDAPTIRK